MSLPIPDKKNKKIPSFNEVMGEQKPIPSYQEVMGEKKKDSENGGQNLSTGSKPSQDINAQIPIVDIHKTKGGKDKPLLEKDSLPDGDLTPTQLNSQLGKLPEPTVDNLYPLEKKALAAHGLFLMPPDEQKKVVKEVISNRQYEKPVPKVVKGVMDFTNPRSLVTKQSSDETFLPKPITEVDIAQKEASAKRHKENLDKAIENTTDRFFSKKGINVGKHSTLWNERYQKIKKSVEEGDATLHIKDGVPLLDRSVGFFEGLSKGWNEAMNNNDEAATFVHDMDTQQRVEYVNKQQEQINKSEYAGENNGVGHFLGGTAPFLAKAGAGYATGAILAAAAPETGGISLAALPTAMSFIYTAPDMANHGGMNETIRRYQMLKHQYPDMSDYDAMRQAESGILVGGIGGITENALMMGTMKLPISLEGKGVIQKFATESLKSGINMGGATALADIAVKTEGNIEGYKSTPADIAKSAVKTFTDNATVGMALHGITQGVSGLVNIPKSLNSAFKYSLKDVPAEEISQTLDANVKEGNITPEVAEKTKQDIEGYKVALSKTANGLSPESQASVAGLIQAKDNISSEMKTKDNSQHELYQKKIDAIDNQIQEISRTNKPLEHEVDEVTGTTLKKPSFDEVTKERVEDLADRISKGKKIEDAIDLQLQSNFPEELEKSLNRILREEKSKNKDSEKPNNEITNTVNKYLEKQEKQKAIEVPERPVEEGKPEEISQPIELSVEPKETEININEIKVPAYKTIFEKGTPEQKQEALKEISGQWHDEGTRQQAERDFGKSLTEKAVKEFPQESQKGLSSKLPSSTVSSEVSKEEKTFTKNALDRADAKKIFAQVREVDVPQDAAQVALEYIANGGKVSEATINEVAGTVKRASLNTGAKEKRSTEYSLRDYSSKTNETLDQLAHNLWEKNDQRIPESDIKDALMDAIGSHTTRLEAGKSYLERYSPEYAEKKQQERFYEEYAQEIEAEEKAITEALNSEKNLEHEAFSDENYVTNLIEKYESEIKGENKQPSSKTESSTNKGTGSETSNEKEKVNEAETNIPIQAEVKEPTITEPNKVEPEASEGKGAFVEDKRTILSHRGLQEVATEFGMDDISSRDRKTDLKLLKDAGETIDKWVEDGSYTNKVEGLVNKAENLEVLNDEQRVILEQHIANERKVLNDLDVNSPEFDAKFKEVERLVKAGEATRSAAGAALRVPNTSSTPNDLAGMMMQEKEINQDAPLTEKQKETVQKEYTDISEAQKAYEEKIAKLEAENARLMAEKEVKKTTATTKKTKRTHEDYVTERKKISESISEKLKAARGQTTATIVPYANELIAIAPDVAKLVKSYVEEGVNKLDDIVKKVHDELKDHIKGIQEKDIHDIIAGEYNEKKKPRNEVTKQIFELKQQAQLINKLEKLKNGIEPKNEKAKVKRNQEIEQLTKQIKEHDLTKLSQYKANVKSQLEKVEEQLRTGNYAPDVKKEPIKLDKEGIELRDKLIKKKQEREIRLIQQKYNNRTAQQKAGDLALEVLNVPRTLMSSMDYSAPLRQGLWAVTSHPQIAGSNFLKMFKDSFSQKYFDRWFYETKESPAYPIMEKSGLFVADPHDYRLSAKEEAFMNNLAEKIPVVGKLIKGSERAYVGFLNRMRVDIFRNFMDVAISEGKTIENSSELYKAMAEYINQTTGRGSVGKLENAAPILNSMFFSPRLIASRINLLTTPMNPKTYTSLPKEVRVEYFKGLLKFIGVGMSVLALAKLSGAQVEDDPRSSDFGKIKSGNTRWDTWGGFQQYIRATTQLASGQRKSTNTGKIQDLNGEGAFGTNRGDVATSFLRGKLAPVPSMAWDFISGRGTTGEPTTILGEAKSHLLPLMFSDVKEAMKDRGVSALFTVGAPSIFGVGTQTYTPREQKPKTKKHQQKKKKKGVGE